MVLNLQRKGRKKGFLEQSAFVVIDIVLLLLTTGLLIKSLGLVFNPDRQVVTFNTEFLKSKINQACEQGESSMVNFGFPQPTPSKLLGASDFLAQFSIAGSKSADPHYVLYYESFPVGEAVGWEVYHSNFDTRIIVPFEYSRFDEKFSRPYDPIHPQFITGSAVGGFLEEMDNYTNFIITEATLNGVNLKKTKKPILYNNIILSDNRNVVPQEPPTSPTKDIIGSVAGVGNAGKWISYSGKEKGKFEFSDYLGLTDEERTYIKYRPCGDNALCLKTRDGVEQIPLSPACRGKYFQLFYDARGDTDSLIYGALFGRHAVKVTKDQLDRIRDAEIAAQKAAKEAEDAIEALKKFEPDIHAKSIERLRELAKNADAPTKAEFETALNSFQSTANNLADAKIAGAGEEAIKAAEKQLADAGLNMRAPLLKAGAPLIDIDVRTGVLKEVSVLDNVKVKRVAVVAEAAKNLKFLRTAERALVEVGEKSKNAAVKVAKIFPKTVNVVCTGVGIFTLGFGRGLCKGAVYGAVAAAAGAFVTAKGIDFAKGMISFALSFKVSDFYLASPCTIEGGSPSIKIERVDDCSVKSNEEPPLCARFQKYPLYKYTEDFGTPTIEYRGDHLTCMDSVSNNEYIPRSEQNIGCIRITVTEQKDNFCFTKNPYVVRKDIKVPVKITSTGLNIVKEFVAPMWISLPAEVGNVKAPGGFDLDDLTAISAAWGALPVNELSSYLPESKAVALAPGELAKGVWGRSKEMVANIVGLSWTWPS